MTEIKELYGAAKAAPLQARSKASFSAACEVVPDTNPYGDEFFSSLLDHHSSRGPESPIRKQSGADHAGCNRRHCLQNGRNGFQRLLKKPEKRIPRGLKAARNDKNKRLERWPEGQLYPYFAFFSDLFRPIFTGVPEGYFA